MLPISYRILAALAVAGMLFAAGGYVAHRWDEGRFNAERLAWANQKLAIEAANTAATQKALADSEAEIARVTAISVATQAKADAYRAAISKSKDQYAKLPKSPLPADCRLSDDRLRVIQSVVAGSTGGTGTTNADPGKPGDPLPPAARSN